MITTSELHSVAEREGLRFDQIEKDYIILWLLSGLMYSGAGEHGWIFKGGTCLRHCYYKGYRFSEDIDFSCLPGRDNLDDSLSLLGTVTSWVMNESGVSLSIREPLTGHGDFQIEIPVEYNRGGARRKGLPQVKVHLTFDEQILSGTVNSVVEPIYSDLSKFMIPCYSKKEIIAEKLRSLLQQQKKWPRPRDLYDLWYILCYSGEIFPWQELRSLFEKKCVIRNIVPDISGLISDTLREWNENAWTDRLGPMLQKLPDFYSTWDEWVKTFNGLTGNEK